MVHDAFVKSVFAALSRAKYINLDEEDMEEIIKALEKSDSLYIRGMAVKVRGAETLVLTVCKDEEEES